MGAQQSQAANGTVSDIAKNYSTLIDAMMTNQVGFASSMKDISDAEREWFDSFERYVAENQADISSEDSLYRNIQAFTRLSGDDTDALLKQIADPGMRASADSVLKRTNKAIVLQKYYEYKYLHLSAVFMNFTEFVQKLFELTASASVQVAENQAVLTTRDVSQLLDAMASVIPAQDAAQFKRTVQAVHKSAHDRLKVMSKQLDKIIEVSKEHIGEFPMKQLEQQQQEGRAQLQRAVDDVVNQAPAPSPATATAAAPGPGPTGTGAAAPSPAAPGQGPPGPPRFGDRADRGDRPPRFGDRADRGDRPPRFGDRSQEFRPRGERPARFDASPGGPKEEGSAPAPTTTPAPGDTDKDKSSPAGPAFGFDEPGAGAGASSSSDPKPNPNPNPNPADGAARGFGFEAPPSSSDKDKGEEGPGEDKNKRIEKAQELSDKRAVPDDAFMFGGGSFLARAAGEIEAIVRGGGRMRSRAPTRKRR